jgi:hypothetical protein
MPDLATSTHDQNVVISGGNENEKANVLAHLLEAYRQRDELQKRDEEIQEELGVAEGYKHTDVKEDEEESSGRGFTDFLLVSSRLKLKQ